MATIRRVRFVVRGRVQGVFYRGSAQQAARGEGLSGWVRNRDDGAVEGEAEGAADAIARFVRWCEVGPPSARVTGVDTEDLAPLGTGGDFEVRR